MATVDYTSAFPIFVVPPSAVTLDGFRSWARSPSFPEKGRITFFRGRLLIDMSPERYETHLKIKDALGRVLSNLVHEMELGDFYPDGAFLTNKSADISNEPDAMFASWETLESGKLAPPSDRPQDGNHIELVGTPDWVCEIVSDSSEEKDATLLLEAYHTAGICEYWLIDARGSEISFRILDWTPNGYQAAASDDGWLASQVFGRQFQLVRTRDRLSRWQYDLRQR